VPLADVARIEVISGPGSTLYGANAVNGVINIVTKDSTQTQGALLDATAGTTDDKIMARYGFSPWDGGAVRLYGQVSHTNNTSPVSALDTTRTAWARNQADIAWMRDTFEYATEHASAAIMFIGQADPGFSTSEFDAPQRNPITLMQTDGNPDGYVDFLLAFRDEIIAFRRPVVYVHGDSHYFRIDKPLLDAHGARLENFTRLETFGDHAENGTNDVNWV